MPSLSAETTTGRRRNAICNCFEVQWLSLGGELHHASHDVNPPDALLSCHQVSYTMAGPPLSGKLLTCVADTWQSNVVHIEFSFIPIYTMLRTLKARYWKFDTASGSAQVRKFTKWISLLTPQDNRKMQLDYLFESYHRAAFHIITLLIELIYF